MSSSTLTIRVDDDQKARLEALAQSTGRSRSYLAADAIRDYLDANEWQVAGVQAAIRSLGETGGVAHGQVRDWVESWDGGQPDAGARARKRKS